MMQLPRAIGLFRTCFLQRRASTDAPAVPRCWVPPQKNNPYWNRKYQRPAARSTPLTPSAAAKVTAAKRTRKAVQGRRDRPLRRLAPHGRVPGRRALSRFRTSIRTTIAKDNSKPKAD
ncbi:hypothetical protein CCMA1212_001901 [Trichoderma ghanense]|uniref:Uncharacterized protein n=1 Tax=Trichoderma ghanense TaxID=65468 RepID=A0ABY2HC06_9HYPO